MKQDAETKRPRGTAAHKPPKEHAPKSDAPAPKEPDLRPAVKAVLAQASVGGETRASWLEKNKPKATTSLQIPVGTAERNELELHWLVWHHLNDNYLFGLDFDKTWRDYAVEALRSRLETTLRHLADLTNATEAGSRFRRGPYPSGTNEAAIAAIVDFAVRATEKLTSHSKTKPWQIRAVARTRFLWPFLAGPKPCFSDKPFSDKGRSLVKEIELGRDRPFGPEHLERIRKDNVSVKFAVRLLWLLEEYRNPSNYVGRTPEKEWQYENPPARSSGLDRASSGACRLFEHARPAKDARTNRTLRPKVVCGPPGRFHPTRPPHDPTPKNQQSHGTILSRFQTPVPPQNRRPVPGPNLAHHAG